MSARNVQHQTLKSEIRNQISLAASRFGVLDLLTSSSAKYTVKTTIKFNNLYTKLTIKLT